MKKQIIIIGIIGIAGFLIGIGLCGCIEDNETNQNDNIVENVTFQVRWNMINKSENITIKNVTIPLNESEAIEVYLTIIGEKPGDIEQIEKTDFGWSIYYGNPVYGFGAEINEVNMTVDIYGGY